MSYNPGIGHVEWVDLTVEDADTVRDFYVSVVGWKPEPVGMGDYNDYNMISADSGTAVAGVCHQRGTNSGLPSQWLIYIRVADLDASMKACVEGGGKIIAGPINMGPDARYCTIQDPAGAVCSLYWKRQ